MKIEVTILAQKKVTKNTRKTPRSSGGLFYFNVTMRVIQSLILFVLCIGIFAASLGLGIGVGYFAFLVEDTKLPSKSTLQQELGNISQTSTLTYANNDIIATVNSDLQRTTVKSDQISDLLKKAIVATEDENFYEHNGFVPKAVLRALVS